MSTSRCSTTRVECTSLGTTILSLRLALITLLGCVTRFSALQVLYLKTTLRGLSCCQRRFCWLLRLGRFIAYTLLYFLQGSGSNYLSRIGSSVIQGKRIQVKRTLVKARVQFTEKSCIYLFTISYLATTELRPQFRRTTAPFITNRASKLPNQTIVDLCLPSFPHGCQRLPMSPHGCHQLPMSPHSCQRLPMSPHGCHQLPMSPHGCHRLPSSPRAQ